MHITVETWTALSARLPSINKIDVNGNGNKIDVWIVIPCENNLYPLNIKVVSTILLTLSVSAIACVFK